MNKSFTGILSDYVLIHVKGEAGQSGATLRSYYTAIDQYTEWYTRTHKTKPEAMDASSFAKDDVRAFLNHLEDDNRVSASTRNLRRAGIVSFLEFARQVSPVYTQAYLDVRSIKAKKAPKPEKSFLTIGEYKAMLECIDITRRNGFSHYILASILYDSAARVDEAVNMDFEHFNLSADATVTILGKGSKYRTVYLTSQSATLIRKAMERYGRKTGPVFLNKSGGRITDSGIDYILKKYAALAAEKEPTLGNKAVSPHTMRRSKATHMLLNGSSIATIQRFLGHENIQTTEEYLDPGSEAMIHAVAEAEKSLKAHGIGNEPITTNWKDPDIMNRLKKLAK